jgi:hypothetical protein
MKKIVYTFIIFISMLGIMVLTSCPGTDPPDPDPEPKEEQLLALMNNGSSRVLASGGVVKDGYDVTDQFTGFKLAIGKYTYSTQNSLAGAWPASGTWEFNNGQINSIKRDDDVVISLALNGSNLTLTFTALAPPGGRIEGLAGDYTFNLKSE